MQAASRNPKSAILLLLAIALIIRLAWVLHLPSDKSVLWQLPDQVEYYKIAQNLLIGKGFHFWDERFDGDVHAFRMPGYPLFVAACGGKVVIVRVVQAVLDASTVLAAYLLARKWMGHRAAMLAGVLVAVNPFLIYFSGLMLSETVFVAMLAWGMYLLVCSGRRLGGSSAEAAEDGGRYKVWVGLLLLVLSVHIRPSALLLPVLLAIAFWRNWRWPLISAAMTVLVLLPWASRNQRLLGEWVWTTTNSGFTLYDGFNPAANGASNQKFIAQMPELKEMSEVQRSKYLSAKAQKYIATDSSSVVRLTLKKLARTWSPIPLSEQFGSRKLYRLVGGGYATVLFGLAIFGLFRAELSKNVKLFLLAPAMYFTIIHAMSVGSLRYRLPAEVPLAVLAGGALIMRQSSDRRLRTAD